MDAAPQSNGAPEAASAKTEFPPIESPPLSPGSDKVAAQTPEPSGAAVVSATRIRLPGLALRARHKRHAVLAASMTFAAAFGAVVGAWASGALFTSASEPAGEQNKTMQQSIARLGKEIAALKVSLEQVSKPAAAQITRTSDRLEHAVAEVTGSASPAAVRPQTGTPLPSPRPAPRAAATEIQPPARTPVVPDWTIRATRNGYVYVENHGDVYRVVPGAPLPGLGPVQSVMRQDGRWMVVTPKGIIVSLRNRRYFEDF